MYTISRKIYKEILAFVGGDNDKAESICTLIEADVNEAPKEVPFHEYHSGARGVEAEVTQTNFPARKQMGQMTAGEFTPVTRIAGGVTGDD